MHLWQPDKRITDLSSKPSRRTAALELNTCTHVSFCLVWSMTQVCAHKMKIAFYTSSAGRHRNHSRSHVGAKIAIIHARMSVQRSQSFTLIGARIAIIHAHMSVQRSQSFTLIGAKIAIIHAHMSVQRSQSFTLTCRCRRYDLDRTSRDLLQSHIC